MAYGDRSVWIGYDDRETLAYAVARHSIQSWCCEPNTSISVHSVVLQDLVDRGWYTRKTEIRKAEGKAGKRGMVVFWDTISEAPMSTQFAISRFFVPLLAKDSWRRAEGWDLFVDCDVLARQDLGALFWEAEQQPDKALVCVPHTHNPTKPTKKGGQPQARVADPRYPGVYTRKNWSSVMLFNRAHPANQALTIELLNTAPGRDLHRFCWLKDEDIGFIDYKWNYLVGVPGNQCSNPGIVHFTIGGPWLPQYADVEYSEEWRAARDDWVRRG